METKILNYRTIITPEKVKGKTVYNAISPTLGVADWGRTVEDALSNIRSAIECHIESLLKHKEPLPAPDADEFMIATTSVSIPPNHHLSFV